MPKKKPIRTDDGALLLQLSKRVWDAIWGLQHLESYFNADHPARVQADAILEAVKDFHSKLPKWIEDEKKVNPPSNPTLKKCDDYK